MYNGLWPEGDSIMTGDATYYTREDETLDWKATTEVLKVAWVRNNTPLGKSAPGRLQCPCGNAPESEFTPGPNVVCACGKVYTWNGWRR